MREFLVDRENGNKLYLISVEDYNGWFPTLRKMFFKEPVLKQVNFSNLGTFTRIKAVFVCNKYYNQLDPNKLIDDIDHFLKNKLRINGKCDVCHDLGRTEDDKL